MMLTTDMDKFYLSLVLALRTWQLFQIYRRTVQNSADQAPSIARMRDEICSAVEAEIQNEVVEYEISDEEYVEVSNAAWARMYSVALQYHQSGLKPMGLMVDAVGRSGKSPITGLGLSIFSTSWVGLTLIYDVPISCTISHSCQLPISPNRTRQMVEQQKSVNPTIRADGPPCKINDYYFESDLLNFY